MRLLTHIQLLHYIEEGDHGAGPRWQIESPPPKKKSPKALRVCVCVYIWEMRSDSLEIK